MTIFLTISIFGIVAVLLGLILLTVAGRFWKIFDIGTFIFWGGILCLIIAMVMLVLSMFNK